MIGNDVVDLNLAKTQSNWRRNGFLDKLFTEEEQKFIKNSNDSFLQVWLFWTMKEAAYKCFTQEFPKRFFAPKKFVCNMFDYNTGIVTIENQQYFTKTEITVNYLHTIAEKKQLKNHFVSLFLIDEQRNQTSFIHHQILAKFPEIQQIQKNQFGIPTVHPNPKNQAISMSHHGNFGAFVISEAV